MKSVLISIQPKWCELITSGKKTIEVRKTRPKLETPFTVYIYCTKPVGKVIGEFVCDRIDTYGYDEHIGCLAPAYVGDLSPYDIENGYWIYNYDHKNSCVNYDELVAYGKGKDLYGWHRSSLIIYDKPMSLSKKPPRSWYYVEE